MFMRERQNGKKRGERVVNEGSREMTLRRSWERWEKVTVLDSVGSKH